MTEYRPILCSDYEVLEVACMDRYKVELDVDGWIIVGNAIDMEVRSPEEFLVVDCENGEIEKIRVDRIRRLRVLSQPRRFSEHEFPSRDG